MTNDLQGPAAAERLASAGLDELGHPHAWLTRLVERRLDRIALPGAGDTLSRWRMLAAVAAWDLSLAKLYEGHTDALAILHELGAAAIAERAGTTWGMWAAEPPDGRVTVTEAGPGQVSLTGTKRWCSGAEGLSHGLLTAWWPDGRGPQLVAVALRQPGVAISADRWQAVGMGDSATADVRLSGARGELVGRPGDYLSRPGFWHGGAGIGACWYGGACFLGDRLRESLRAAVAAPATGPAGAPGGADPHRLAALGRVDLQLCATAALLREAARWIDAHPRADAQAWALRVRQAAEACAADVLREVGLALGAAPYCLERRFARMAADLPVFIRQSHGPRDLAASGRCCAAGERPWTL